MTREQLEMMVFLISGNCEGLVELLLRTLEEKVRGGGGAGLEVAYV